jgi:hypothetical protein
MGNGFDRDHSTPPAKSRQDFSNRPRPRTGTLGATTFAIKAFSFLASLAKPFRERTTFPAIPVRTGIFAICQKNRRLPTANWEADQSLVGQFPLPAKREFIRD